MQAAMGQPGQPLGVPTVASLSAEAGIGGGFIEPPPFCPPVDEKPLDLKKVKTQLCRSAGRGFKLRTTVTVPQAESFR